MMDCDNTRIYMVYIKKEFLLGYDIFFCVISCCCVYNKLILESIWKINVEVQISLNLIIAIIIIIYNFKSLSFFFNSSTSLEKSLKSCSLTKNFFLVST